MHGTRAGQAKNFPKPTSFRNGARSLPFPVVRGRRLCQWQFRASKLYVPVKSAPIAVLCKNFSCKCLFSRPRNMDNFKLGLRAVVVLVAIYILLKIAEWVRCTLILRKLPAPDGNPLLGQLPVLARPDHHNVLAKWAADLGGIYRMRLAHIIVGLCLIIRVLSGLPAAVREAGCLGRDQEAASICRLWWSPIHILLLRSLERIQRLRRALKACIPSSMWCAATTFNCPQKTSPVLLTCKVRNSLKRQSEANLFPVQLLHAHGKPNIFTSHTDDHWKLVRKGVAPAFSPKNIRSPSHSAPPLQ